MIKNNKKPKDRLNPSIYGVGFIGIGKFKSCKGKSKSKIYQTWQHMLARCYCNKTQKIQPTYIGCTVCIEWHNFQNFAEWHQKNYIDGFFLDKDIKRPGNKVYSPDNCLFVPSSINNLLTDCRSSRGEFPIGAYFNKKSKRYRAQIRIDGECVHLGLFKTAKEASEHYKSAKNSEINRKAKQYPEFAKYLIQHLYDLAGDKSL